MSLSSLLLGANGAVEKGKGKGKAIDKGLDDIFRSTAVLPVTHKAVEGAATPSNASEKKRKHKDDTVLSSAKRVKAETKLKANPPAVSGPDSKQKKKARKSKAESVHAGSDAESDDRTLPTAPHNQAADASTSDDAEGLSKSDASDGEGDPSTLVHESLAKKSKGQRAGKKKYVPPDETAQQRDARTIFVGNVPVEVATSRPLTKQFRRHILSFIPTAKIESVRFRSVAFSKPTAQSPSADGEVKPKGKAQPAEKEGRQHDRDRAASWRKSQPQDEDEAAAAKSAKTFLTPKEKKRVAFIKQEVHSGVDAVNAYVVFAHAPPQDETRPANLPPPVPTMDPFDAASTAAQSCDGTVFMERTLRADVVGKGDKPEAKAGMSGDPKATVFVGNLDFASKEEDLRVFFEGVVSAERGPPVGTEDEPSDGEDDEEMVIDGTEVIRAKKPKTWVKRVRIIRDRDTQLGKGFAYVQFVDRACVDEILAFEADRLKFAKRKLRVQRCKTLPGGTVKTSVKSATPQQSKEKRRASIAATAAPVTSIPKGDPTLGAKISHLSKEDRKQAKATDSDRVARRLAKKKAKGKMTLVEKGVKVKERERIRKKPGDKKRATSSAEKPKRRVRSNNAMAKLNTKK